MKETLDDLAGVTNWTWHDLRRMLRSGLRGLGIDPDTAERALGHAPPSLRSTYDRHDFMREKRAALDKWAAHVEAIVSGRAKAAVISLYGSAAS